MKKILGKKEINVRKNKGFSIITNFGCDTNCKYCIWKNHPLNNNFTTVENTDWNKLRNEITKYFKISISGGGDPFFNIEKNWNWFEKLFQIYHGKIDVHTSKILNDKEKYKYFNKIVFHLNYNRFIVEWNLIQTIPNKKRLVFVIDNNITLEQIKNIIQKVGNVCQLSFRELYGDKNLRIRKLENYANKNSFLIQQKDYNIYYMPNNEIWQTFL